MTKITFLVKIFRTIGDRSGDTHNPSHKLDLPITIEVAYHHLFQGPNCCLCNSMEQLISIDRNYHCRNNSNHPISSNSYPSATANKAIQSLKIGGGGLQNQREHDMILTKYDAVHPTAVSEPQTPTPSPKRSPPLDLHQQVCFLLCRCIN